MGKISLIKPLFLEDPDEVFAKKRKVKPGLLNEMYHRYFVKEYTFKDLQEYYEVKTKRKPIDRKNLSIWLKRIEVFKRAKIGMEFGARECTLEFFGENADFVIKELKKRKNA